VPCARSFPIVAAVLMASLTTPATLSAQSPPTGADLERARALYETGTAHYRERDYEAAVRDYQEGFRLSGQAGFLFNVAQAQRLAGSCAQALASYRGYVAIDPSGRYREEALARADEMNACVAAGATGTSAPRAPEPVAEASPPLVPGTTSPVPAAPAPIAATLVGDLRKDAPPPAPRGLWRSRSFGLVLTSAGVAAGVGSAFFFYRAHLAGQRVQMAHSTQAGPWTPDDQDAETEGRRADAAGVACLVASALSLTLGSVVLIRSTEREPAVNVTLKLAPDATEFVGLVGSW
jgi:hypothetical protein